MLKVIISLFLFGFISNTYSKNVILLSIDTLSAKHLSLYGYHKKTAPFISSLSNKCMLFKNHFANADHTAPTHMSIFTGLYPVNHKVFRGEVYKSKINLTIAEVLKKNNYKTYWFAPITDISLSKQIGLQRGFNDIIKPGLYGSNLKSVIQKLKKILKSKNNFVFLHTYITHDPYTPPFEYTKDKIINLERYLSFKMPISWRWGEGVIRKKYWDNFNITKKKDVDKLINYYDYEITYMDTIVEKLYNSLGNNLDDVTIILTSDHGEAFGEHQYFRHETLDDEVLQIPLIICNSKLKKGVDYRLTESVDLYNTILDELNIKNTQKNDGQSLIDKNKKLKTILYANNSRSYMLQNHKYKLYLDSLNNLKVLNNHGEVIKILNGKETLEIARLKQKLINYKLKQYQ